MTLKDELQNVKIKTAKKAVKQKDSKIVPEVKNDNVTDQSSILPAVKVSNAEKPKPEEKPKGKQQIVITGQPAANNTKLKDNDGLMIDFEITPEMIEATLQGCFESIHIIAPKTFKEPEPKHIKALTGSAVVVVKRWIPKIDMLKYLPEITLAAGILVTLKSMRIEPEQKKMEQ